MDGQTIAWMPGILLFVLGLAAGGGLAYLFLPSRKGQRLEEQLHAQEEQHARYRTEVVQHFNKTAELVNNMTQSYKAVYQHLAQGAENLCSEEPANPALRFSEPRLIGEQSTAAPAPHPAPAPAPAATPAPAPTAAAPTAATPRRETTPPPKAPADHPTATDKAAEPAPATAKPPAADPVEAPKDYAPERRTEDR